MIGERENLWNINDESIFQIWSNNKFNETRKKLAYGDRIITMQLM